MESVVLVIHLILALAIIALVLLQRSEGGGLGIGGGGGGLGGLASARGTANALTKMTGICAFGFFVTSLTLAVLAGGHSRLNASILDEIEKSQIQAPVVKDDISAPLGTSYSPPDEAVTTTDDIPALNVEEDQTPAADAMPAETTEDLTEKPAPTAPVE